MVDLNVPVNDLHGLFDDKAIREKSITGDGVHFSGEGSARLGATVAEFVKTKLPGAK